MGAGAIAEIRDVTVYWTPHHEVYPELPRKPDFLAFDEATDKDVGRVCEMIQYVLAGSWRWSMYARSHTGRVPFETHGYAESRGQAGRRVVEAYKRLLAHNEQHPRKAPPDRSRRAGLPTKNGPLHDPGSW